MLDWLKRIAAPAPREPVGEHDSKLERLIDRLGATGRIVEEAPEPAAPAAAPGEPRTANRGENENRPPAAEEPASNKNVERLAGRAATPLRLVSEPAGGSSAMRVIAVASQKGGCGKTTIAAHLAVRAGLIGQGPAVLVDTDPQHSLTDWWRERNDSSLALAPAQLDGLAAALAELRSRGAAVAIVDTPPALTASIEQAIALADLVLIPARPSPHDLRAIGATVALTQRAKKPFLFVINGAAPRASITAECVAALSEHGRVAPGILYQRTDFAASMIDGRTVMETVPAGRSAQEIAELWKCVYAQISMRRAA